MDIKITKKRIIVFCTIIFIIGIIILTYFLLINQNKNKLSNYFKSQGFSVDEGIWSKSTEENKNDIVTTTNEVYTPDINKFTKEIKSNSSKTQEQYHMIYNGEETINITYNFNGTDENNNKCMLTQIATYNYKNKEFKCDLKYRSGTCSMKCDKIKKNSEKFGNEIKNILKAANVNEFFLIKNKI